MAYIDKNSAKELVKKHKDLFEKIASNGKFEDDLRKMVGKAYLVMLVLKTISIGLVWWFLSFLNPFYGVFFLLVVALVQAKFLLDKDFANVADNIIDAAEEVGIINKSGEKID